MFRHVTCCVLSLFAATACAQQPADEKPEDGVVARFGAEVVTEAQLADEEELRLQLVAIKQQEYEVKRQHLEQMIFQRLVDQAAAAEGVDRNQYLTTHIMDKISEPSEDEVGKVMSAYRARLNPDPEKARQQVVGMLKQQNGQDLQTELQKKLFREAGVEILLEPMRFEARIADYNPSRGAGADAPITLIEYSDFQCPYCSRVQPTIDELMTRYQGQIRHVFKHLPLPMHREAGLAAEASLCAQDQGRFWDLQDWMFSNSRRLNRQAVVTRAETLDMDVAAFEGCLDAERHAASVKRDMEEAQSFGIQGTPGFLVNGRFLNGARPIDDFVKIIDEELQRAGVDVPEPPPSEEEQPAS